MSELSARARAFDMAEMLRDGHTLHEVAAAAGLPKAAIQGRLRTGGWSWRTGHPLDTCGYEPDPAPPDPLLAFVAQPWADQALCAQTDPDAFFPERGCSGRSVQRPKAVCAACPVRAECLDWALTTPQRFGIWGGLSERERRKRRAAA